MKISVADFMKVMNEWTEFFFNDFNDNEEYKGRNFTWTIFRERLLPNHIKQQIRLHNIKLDNPDVDDIGDFGVFLADIKCGFCFTKIKGENMTLAQQEYEQNDTMSIHQKTLYIEWLEQKLVAAICDISPTAQMKLYVEWLEYNIFTLKNYKKPPVGLRPANLINQTLTEDQQLTEVCNTIHRYLDSKTKIPLELIEEYNRLSSM